MSDFHINPDIYKLFGGKKQTKKAKPKKQVKAERHTDYSQITLNKVNKIKVETESIVHDIQLSNTQYKNSIDFSQNKSRDSDCDEFTTNDNSIDYHSPILLNHTYSVSTSNHSFGDLFLDTQSRASDSDIDTNSPLFEYNYTFEDLHTCGAINMPKLDVNESPIKTNTTVDLLGNSNAELSDSDYETPEHTPQMNANISLDDMLFIGAIRTNEYIQQKRFEQNRQTNIRNDLFDMIVSDSDEYNDDGMTIIELLNKFQIGSFIDYFDSKLNIEFVNEIIDFKPSVIQRNLYNDNLQTTMSVYNMFQFLFDGIISGEFDGLESEKWISLYNNNMFTIHQHPSSKLLSYNDVINTGTNNKNNIIKLDGTAKHERTFDIFSVEKVIRFTVIELPEKSPGLSAMCLLGINVNEDTIYIDDRLSIYKNDTYLSNIGFGSFIENNSEIVVKCRQISESSLEISILNDYEKKIKCELSYPLTMCNVFVEQFVGKGEYYVDIV